MTIRVAINGFGRIGRNFLRILHEKNIEDVEVVLINHSKDLNLLAHLIKYDSCYGRFNGTVEIATDALVINGQKIDVTAQRDINELPWADYNIDMVIEATGKFTERKNAIKHIENGVKKVIISAPAKDEDITIVMGVNESEYKPDKHHIISNASCTTNCLAPFSKVIDEKFGIKRGLMTTIHAYTNDQRLLDGTHSDLRRSRAATESIIPTSTGAALAIGKVLPSLSGLINGNSMRVPTSVVSVVDIVFDLEIPTCTKEINAVLEEASKSTLKGILDFSNEPLVSIDYKRDPHSSIIDGLSTMMIGSNMVKLVSWYDNEWGFSNRVVDLARYIARSM
ncbi:type I glyceraldehyde-3-phosphate dehydrogenase [Alkalibaculum sp. M08DMB]|uniref:Glyceraldehyde-3-phosphate dehydrogenase n=1 Tax=Alkalibaculum sporogenes TaxID=2655001 RepID=A0A6A7K8X6_9FIRM|nr:type I glyceraldehyde-3-phosphate dehydrogenase [Alkalibaculum sporogenes]MPW25928.1 type I glyceraldehyde-3-phosphate dehydrogenase [Alkalibaculum sporogenes]